MRIAILSLALCLMVALESTAIKYVQREQKEDIPSEQLVFLVEVFKLVVSIVVYCWFRAKEKKGEPLLARSIVRDEDEDEDDGDDGATYHDPLERKGVSSVIWFILPSCLYAISNNVTFAALMLMSPALFNLLMNLKIPLTGFMACALLGYKLTKNLAVSFIFLFIGSILATLRFSKDGSITIEGTIYGLILMFVYASCSAGAAVYTEYVTKTRYPSDSIHLQNAKFCFCSMVANVVLILLRGRVPFTQLQPIHLLSVTALGTNGLVTSAVLKYAGSIVKTYAVSCAAFLSAVFTWYVFHQNLNWNFYVGGVICAASVNLYLYEKKASRDRTP